jgi:hypothetical protein
VLAAAICGAYLYVYMYVCMYVTYQEREVALIQYSDACVRREASVAYNVPAATIREHT